MTTMIVLGIIFIYAGFIIYKKVKDIKAGKYCSCGCGDCPSAKRCHTSSLKREINS